MVEVQRRGTTEVLETLYQSAGVLELERYFLGRSALASTVMRYRFDPGTREGLHLHAEGAADSCTPGDSDEVNLVVSGELVMTVDGDRTTLRAGDAAYAPAGTLHGIANESERPAEMVLVVGPPSPRAPGSG